MEISCGYCKCGCGEKTTVSKINDSWNGYVAGKPRDYCIGHGYRNSTSRPCLACGKSFKADRSRAKYNRGKYCSVDCKKRHCRQKNPNKWRHLRCPSCEKTFSAPTYEPRRRYCSMKCKVGHYKGAVSPLYRGKLKARGQNWPRMKRLVLRRDEYHCSDCNISRDELRRTKKRVLEVHHLRPVRFFVDKEAANDPSNLITLCYKCHHKRDYLIRVMESVGI